MTPRDYFAFFKRYASALSLSLLIKIRGFLFQYYFIYLAAIFRQIKNYILSGGGALS